MQRSYPQGKSLSIASTWRPGGSSLTMVQTSARVRTIYCEPRFCSRWLLKKWKVLGVTSADSRVRKNTDGGKSGFQYSPPTGQVGRTGGHGSAEAADSKVSGYCTFGGRCIGVCFKGVRLCQMWRYPFAQEISGLSSYLPLPRHSRPN